MNFKKFQIVLGFSTTSMLGFGRIFIKLNWVGPEPLQNKSPIKITL